MNDVLSGNTIPILSIVTAVGLVLFWIGFFTIGLAPANPPPCYFAYEHSFPVPDILLAVVLLTGGILSLTGSGAHGATLLVAGGGALVFLGILDISFNLQNGMYSISLLDMLLNAFINLWCVLFGAAIVVKVM